jgi:hypothetical protein
LEVVPGTYTFGARLRRWRELIILPRIPRGHRVARYCRKKFVQDGQITPQAFEPRPGESYLSVHWLEYLTNKQQHAHALLDLRTFLTTKTSFTEMKLEPKGALAVLDAASVRGYRRGWELVLLACRHAPRCKPFRRYTGVACNLDEPGFDPHSAIYSMPWRGAERLAVQQYLLSKVVHSEPGKI